MSQRTVFFPFQKIKLKNEKFFSGRIPLLRRVLINLQMEGSCAIIYGDRQIGKSSFANQLMYIMQNKSSILDDYHFSLSYNRRPKCISIDSSSTYMDVKGLLAHLINSETEYSLNSYFPKAFEHNSIKRIKETTNTWGISVKIIKLERRSTQEHEPAVKVPDVVFDYFKDVIKKIDEIYPGDEIYFFIDEFDLLTNSTGFGELIKILERVHFIIIGIADSYKELVEDHASMAHKLQGNTIKLPYWDDSEISQIFQKAEIYYNREIKFNQSFLDRVFEDCGGLPGYAHLIGQHALSIINEEYDQSTEKIEINSDLYDKAINRIFNLDLYSFEDNLEQENFAQLIDIIHDKPLNREIVGKLSEYPGSGVNEDELYESVSESARKDFYLILGELCDQKQFLKRSRDNRVRFSLPLSRIATKISKKYADRF